MHSYKRRSSITLLEIMIVILLIGLIGGVLSYNLKGTLDRGKAFRSEEGIKRIKDILDLAAEQDPDFIKNLPRDSTTGIVTPTALENCITESGFVSENKVKEFTLDGWKEPYIVKVSENKTIEVSSSRLQQYQNRNTPPQQ